MKKIKETQTGPIVSFNYDDEIAEITGLTADITPTQDLHGYDKPWAGGNGKNKLQVNATGETTYGITWTVDSDGIITANGTVPSDAAGNAETIVAGGWGIDGLVIGTDIDLTVGNTYKLVKGNANTAENFFLFFSNSSGSVIGSANANNGEVTFTIPSGAVYLNAVLRINKGTTVSNLKAYPMIVATTESSDFEPYSNICPISGWTECNLGRTGKNLFNPNDVTEGKYITGDGDIGTLAEARYTGLIPVVSGDSYVFQYKSTTTEYMYRRVAGYDAFGNFIQHLVSELVNTTGQKTMPFTVPSGVKYVRVSQRKDDIDNQIEKGSTATAYEPFGNTYTIDLNGTRYGGTIDVTSGVMRVTHALRTGLTASNTGTSGSGVKYADIGITGLAQNASVISSQYIQINTSATGIEGAFKAYSGALTVYDNRFTSKSVADTALADVEWLLPLATPLAVQLTAEQIEALQGQNNVWANCGDITLSWIHAPVLSEAVMLNGKYLEMSIDGYTTLGTSGRRSLGREIDAYTVGTADGETVKNSRFPVRKITVNYVIQTDTEEELTEAINQLANILNQDECDFVFRDESDKFFSGYGLLDSEPKKYRHAVKGTWSLYCAYPFKRSNKLVELSSKDPTVASVDAHSATFVFDYNGTLPAHPILRAEFASAKSGGEYNEDGDCGYVAFLDAEENIIQLGNPEVLDVDQYANATLINREFTSLSGWTASGVTVGDLTDQFWQNGKGQTQSYAKGTGSFTKSVGNGAINMEFDIVHRLCVSAANQTGAFECYAKNGNKIVVGFKIEKTGSGTTGTVSYILNDKVVGTDSIDLSYYNTHFGYCNRTAVYGTEYYSVYEKYYVKKKGKKKKKYHWVTYPRTVQTGWSYTQSNLNSGWSKDGPVVIFSVGNLPDRTFKNSDVELTPSTSIVFNISGSFHTNGVHSCAMLSKAGVPFAEIPNVFTAGDVVEGDCNSADVMLYRKGSLEGHLEPQYGALGNDWEDFEIKPGKNIIRAVWSDWVNTSYKPEIKIIFNEVYV